MKLTWFGGTTLRIHVGGEILVVDPRDQAGIAREELLSGADRTVELGAIEDGIDPLHWQPRRATAMIDESEAAAVFVHGLAGGSAVIEGASEAPLVLLRSAPQPAGRWARDAVVVAFTPEAAEGSLDVLAPRLIALAMPEADVDKVVAGLRDRLNGTGLVALEFRLALEV